MDSRRANWARIDSSVLAIAASAVAIWSFKLSIIDLLLFIEVSIRPLNRVITSIVPPVTEMVSVKVVSTLFAELGSVETADLNLFSSNFNVPSRSVVIPKSARMRTVDPDP